MQQARHEARRREARLQQGEAAPGHLPHGSVLGVSVLLPPPLQTWTQSEQSNLALPALSDAAAGGGGGGEGGGASTLTLTTAAATAAAAAAAAVAAAAAAATARTHVEAASQAGTGPGAAGEAAGGLGAGAAGSSQVVCKHWLNTGRCWKGAACPHAHLQAGSSRTAAMHRYLADRQESRRRGAAAAGFEVHDTGSAADRVARACVLAAWIVEQYGVAALNRGSGVLDVAGGRGALSFQLQVRHGVKVTLVEPRPLKLSRQQHRLLEQLQVSIGPAPTSYPAASVPTPAHKAGRADALDAAPSTVGLATDRDNTEPKHLLPPASSQQPQPAQQPIHTVPLPMQGSPVPTQFGRREPGELTPGSREAQPGMAQAVVDPPVLCHRLVTGHVITQVQAWFTQELWSQASATSREAAAECGEVHCEGSGTVYDAGSGVTAGGTSLGELMTDPLHTDWRSLLRDCSLVVGLHPDQATDEILRFANSGRQQAQAAGSANDQQQLRKERPFVIVPCCVFPRLFTHRRVRRGPPAQRSSEPSARCQAAETAVGDAHGSSTDERASPYDNDGGMWDLPAELSRSWTLVDPPPGQVADVDGSGMPERASQTDHTFDVRRDTASDRHRGSYGEGRGPEQRGPASLSGRPLASEQVYNADGKHVLHTSLSQVAGGEDRVPGQPPEAWEPVVTYRQLVDYLVQEGGPGTEATVLPLQGANIAVFR
ncbi:hypothetical protein V8C86DRAFT_2613633, partial [Haematococcus lacustris]